MAYLRSYYKPKSKGKYWRAIFNSYRSIRPFSIDVIKAIRENHLKINESDFNLAFPVLMKNFKSDSPGNDLLKRMEVASNFYDIYTKEILTAYKFVLPDFRRNKRPTFEFVPLSDEMRKLANSCIGYRTNKIKDERTFDEKVRDYWFNSGFSPYISDLEKFVFSYLALLIDPSILPSLPIHFINKFLPLWPARAAAKWAFETFPNINDNKWEEFNL